MNSFVVNVDWEGQTMEIFGKKIDLPPEGRVIQFLQGVEVKAFYVSADGEFSEFDSTRGKESGFRPRLLDRPGKKSPIRADDFHIFPDQDWSHQQVLFVLNEMMPSRRDPYLFVNVLDIETQEHICSLFEVEEDDLEGDERYLFNMLKRHDISRDDMLSIAMEGGAAVRALGSHVEDWLLSV